MERWTKAWVTIFGSPELKALVSFIMEGDFKKEINIKEEEHVNESIESKPQ